MNKKNLQTHKWSAKYSEYGRQLVLEHQNQTTTSDVKQFWMNNNNNNERPRERERGINKKIVSKCAHEMLIMPWNCLYNNIQPTKRINVKNNARGHVAVFCATNSNRIE